MVSLLLSDCYSLFMHICSCLTDEFHTDDYAVFDTIVIGIFVMLSILYTHILRHTEF